MRVFVTQWPKGPEDEDSLPERWLGKEDGDARRGGQGTVSIVMALTRVAPRETFEEGHCRVLDVREKAAFRVRGESEGAYCSPLLHSRHPEARGTSGIVAGN
jgi:hypothetical protein